MKMSKQVLRKHKEKGEVIHTMEISVNGEKKNYPGPMTVAELLCELGVNPRAVAVERNLNIVARDDFDKEIVGEGDSIEVIRMVGGG